MRDTFAWNVASIVLGLVAGVLTARLLLPEGKGVLALVLTTISLTGLFTGLGTNVAVRIFQPRGLVTLGAFWKVTCGLALGAAVASTLVVVAIGVWVDPVMLDPAHASVAVFLGIVMFLGNQLLDAFNAVGRVSFSAFLNVVALLFIVLILLAASVGTVSLLVVLSIYAVSYALRLFLALWALRGSGLHEWSGIGNESRLLVKKGVPLLGMNVGQALTFRLDQLFLGWITSASAVGVYAVAATPASVGQVFANTVGQVVFRKVSTGEYRKREVLVSASAVLFLTSVFATVMYLMAPWLVPLLFGPAYVESVPLLRLLVLAEVCIAPYMVLSRAIAGAKMISFAGWSGVFGLVAMFVSLMLLVPPLGATGAALGCITAYSLMTFFSLSVILFRRWGDPASAPVTS